MDRMVHRRFQETAAALKGCWMEMDEDDRNMAEAKARLEIIELAIKIADEYAHELGHEVAVAWAEQAA